MTDSLGGSWRAREGLSARFSSAAVAALHARSFRGRGRSWSPTEVAAMRADPALCWIEAVAPSSSERSDERETDLAGFAVVRLVLDEAELLTICRSEIWAGQGLGDALLAMAMTLARSRGARAMFLEVAASNRTACNLYDALGFRQVGRRSRYYRLADGAAEDALVLRAQLDGA